MIVSSVGPWKVEMTGVLLGVPSWQAEHTGGQAFCDVKINATSRLDERNRPLSLVSSLLQFDAHLILYASYAYLFLLGSEADALSSRT